MKQEVTNFSRFYASFNELPCYCGDREDFKKEVVSQYTFGRTESLKEMTRQEYKDCCDGMEKLSGRKARLRLPEETQSHQAQRWFERERRHR